MTDILNKPIVITGASGSGKSTIGKIIQHRYKDVHVVDTDDIDDASFFELLDNNKYFRDLIEAGSKDVFKLHFELNIKKRDQIIKDYAPHKTVIFVGMTLDFKDIDHIGIFLDTPAEFNFRVVNKRTLTDICQNSTKLTKLIDTESPQLISPLILFEYKIRQRFPVNFDEITIHIQRMKKHFADIGYEILSGQHVIDYLNTILTPLISIHNINNKEKENIIIHVAGVQGSGKSHMGEKLNLYYGDIVYVKDLDMLYAEFITDDLTNYQGYIDDYIMKHSDRPIIFVGLDADICLGPKQSINDKGKNKDKNKDINTFYNLHANHKFFIDISDQKVVEQKLRRQIQKIHDRIDDFIELWIQSPQLMQEKLIRYVDIGEWLNTNPKCKAHYIERGYDIMTYDEILDKIKEIMNHY